MPVGYDTIGATLFADQAGGVNLLDYVPQFLDKITTEGQSHGGQYLTGYLDTLKISVTANRIKITEGSIIKYHLKDPFKTMTRGDTKKAFEHISDSLHLPFERANVNRIDFGTCIILEHPENLYYKYLGEAQYYERLEQPNGLLYTQKTKNRSLAFYGKVNEQKSKGKPIPELYQDRYVWKYENRYLQRLGQQFNRDKVLVTTLWEEPFFENLVTRWTDEYFSIHKQNSKVSSMKPTGSTKELVENMAIMAMWEMGQIQIMNVIREWRECKLITKKQAMDHRECIRRLAARKYKEGSPDLVAEIDKKIKQISRGG